MRLHEMQQRLGWGLAKAPPTHSSPIGWGLWAGFRGRAQPTAPSFPLSSFWSSHLPPPFSCSFFLFSLLVLPHSLMLTLTFVFLLFEGGDFRKGALLREARRARPHCVTYPEGFWGIVSLSILAYKQECWVMLPYRQSHIGVFTVSCFCD